MLEFFRKHHAVPANDCGIDWANAGNDALVGWARGGNEEAKAECLKRYYRMETADDPETSYVALRLLYAARGWQFISADERFLLHRRPDRYYDVVPADGPKLNKSRLSLTDAKELAEQTSVGPVVKDCTGRPLPAEAMATMHDGGDVGSIPAVGSLTAGMRAILSPVAEQRTKKPKGKPLVEVFIEEPKAEPETNGYVDLANGIMGKPKKAKKKESKLRGGIGGDPKVEAPPPPALTTTQIQAKLDELVWRHGSNVTEWLDYPKLLADAGLHPEQVTDFMIELAAEHAKERQTRETKREEGPKEYRLGNLYVGACVQVIGGSKAEIVANNDSEIKVKVIDEHGKQATQHWSPGTMVRVLSRDEFKTRKPAEPLTTPVTENTIAESPVTETQEEQGEITVMQVAHVDAVNLLKTWYPTADGFNAKKAVAKLRSLPERLASDPEAPKPTDKTALKLLESIIAGADAGEDIEVVNGDGASETDGTVVKKVVKKTGGKAKAAKNGNGKHAAPKAAKTEKKAAKAKVTNPKKATKDGEGVDAFGSRLGTSRAAINAALGKKPKSVEQLAKDAGLENTFFRKHIKHLVERGFIAKSDEGYTLKK